MPPPRGTPNFIEGPGDYDVTSVVHSDTYAAIDPTKADLSGKAVFITGGSRGLGRAMALSFARAGASYIAVGARSDMSQLAQDIASAATAAQRSAPKFLPLQLDVTSQQSVEEAAAAVDREFGKCDIVINNAGILGGAGPLVDTDPHDWWQVFDVNVRGPYLVSRAFVPLLLRGGDKYLIQVASVAALLANPNRSAYQTSKVAVMRLTQLIDAEYAQQGLTTFCIHPGNCPTDIVGNFDDLPDDLKLVFVDTPQLSADTLAYLTSEKRQWLGGRYLNVFWDMPELMAKEDEIVKDDKLKVHFVY